MVAGHTLQVAGFPAVEFAASWHLLPDASILAPSAFSAICIL
jgi:hypothetical protein